MYTVRINFIDDRFKQKLVRNISPGQTLLEVCQANKINLSFTCGGVCSCSTCHIFLQKGEKYLDEKSKRETDFIKRAKGMQSNSRLACQCLLSEESGEIEITIPDQLELI